MYENSALSATSKTIYFHALCEPPQGGRAVYSWAAITLAPTGKGVSMPDSANGILGSGPGWTGHVAMYQSLIIAAQEAIKQEWEHPIFVSCSKLVVEQLNGNWACDAPSLITLRDKARALLDQLGATIEYRPKLGNIAVSYAVMALKNWRAA